MKKLIIGILLFALSSVTVTLRAHEGHGTNAGIDVSETTTDPLGNPKDSWYIPTGEYSLICTMPKQYIDLNNALFMYQKTKDPDAKLTVDILFYGGGCGTIREDAKAKFEQAAAFDRKGKPVAYWVQLYVKNKDNEEWKPGMLGVSAPNQFKLAE